MSRQLNDLDYRVRPAFFEFLARLTEAGIHVVVVNTRRTAAEQAIAVANGKSWTQHSAHQDGLAMDVCPYSVWQLHGDDKLTWDESDPVWQKIGLIGQHLGLKWGVVVNGKRKDSGHFEYIMPIHKPSPPPVGYTA